MKILLLALLVSTSAFAKFPLINIQGIHGDYLDEKGKASAEKAFYVVPNVKISHQNIEIDFNKKDQNLVIRDPQTTVELGFNFDFLNIFKAIAFEDVNIKSNEKVFTVNAGILDLYIKPKQYRFHEVMVQTDVSNLPQTDIDDIDILDGLILTGKLASRKMTFRDYDVIVFDELRAENPEHIEEINEIEKRVKKFKIPLVVRLIKFDMDKGKFTGRAKLDSYINLWLRLNGSMKVNKEQTLLTIQIDRVKLGIFSFRKILLRQLRRLNLNNVTIDGNKILVKLKN